MTNRPLFESQQVSHLLQSQHQTEKVSDVIDRCLAQSQCVQVTCHAPSHDILSFPTRQPFGGQEAWPL